MFAAQGLGFEVEVEGLIGWGLGLGFGVSGGGFRPRAVVHGREPEPSFSRALSHTHLRFAIQLLKESLRRDSLYLSFSLRHKNKHTHTHTHTHGQRRVSGVVEGSDRVLLCTTDSPRAHEKSGYVPVSSEFGRIKIILKPFVLKWLTRKLP